MKKTTVSTELERAWSTRKERGFLAEPVVRIFHGPAESRGVLKHCAIDRFDKHFWVVSWSDRLAPYEAELAEFLKSKGGSSAVMLRPDPKQGLTKPERLFGRPPPRLFPVRERDMAFLVRMLDVRNPGLYLDHAPLRAWLYDHSRGWDVLHAFAFTGSLGVAAMLGGAKRATFIDFAAPNLGWIKSNWALNDLPPDRGELITGDVFEHLPRMKREGRRFDCVIFDPPPFAPPHGGDFSVDRDLRRLHELGLDVLRRGGVLVTSVHAGTVSRREFEDAILAAAASRRAKLLHLAVIEQPETIPSTLGDPHQRDLKGWILCRCT